MDVLRRVSLLFFALVLCACGRNRYVALTGYAQGGIYTVKYRVTAASAHPRQVQDSIDAILSDIDRSVSGYNKASLLSRFNRGESVLPDRYFAELLALSDSCAAETGGAFDAFAAPLFDVWGFGFTADSLPPPARVQEALSESALHRKVNFNAIAQGYSCDVVARYLHSLGVTDMLVDIGEIYCEGVNPSGRGWTIGIDTPRDGSQVLGEEISGIWQSGGGPCGVVTSGDYRKFYIRDGRKYAHTIDPRTGYPVGHGLLSATVVAPTAAVADAFATACMVMGPELSQAFILSRPELEGCLITADSLWCSPGFTLKR